MTEEPLYDTVAAVTGASSGIGEAVARLLAARGARLVLGARRTDRLDRIAADLAPERVRTVATDVTRADDLVRLVSTAVDEFGRLDVLVNNAGVASLGPFADGDIEAWTAMIDVNLRGVLHGIAAAMPVFLRQGHGDFVTTVSTAGMKIVPEMGVYAATKNAVRTALEALRQESTDGVIRTTAISPGYVRTDLGAPGENVEPGSHMPAFAIAPEAVARAVAFALEQPRDVEIGELVIRPTVQN
ncbi:NADP-dependent 3-hydroxy acid dehydrogenase YdfG [Mycolicibacterium rutilum]|uniref:NADP-dependent 3-hydroxy acid dehydrogenase YdfG n=1 Tax=Mycolicibacterium rutilum TaxID=370526 RepID=A0A1H6KRG0_MYCRU|nr:SDR family oxidoreductase [Mycolicibacterium rutilum]SEH78379.1 NADP-dependent 3-hydroxy acid dehydrogenase YdfG [Mycolicibacterium rutilum]